jgi:hypothetical protein
MCGHDNNQTKEVGVSHRLAGPNARLIGKPGGLRELTTPAMVLDLEAFEQNVRAYQHQINSDPDLVFLSSQQDAANTR